MLTREQVYQRLLHEHVDDVWPEGTPEILHMLGHPDDIDLDDLSDKIAQVPEIENTLLRNLNSGGYQLRRHIDNAKDAILLLGIEATRNVFLFFVSHQFFPVERKATSQLFATQVYWQHVLATALAVDELAKKKHMDEKQAYLLFTYGLIHDIGILTIDSQFPAEVEAINALLAKGATTLEAEGRILGGVTHPEVGAWVCQRAHFSDTLVTAIRYHHDAYEIRQHGEAMTLLAIADIIGVMYVEEDLPIGMHRTIDKRLLNSVDLTMQDAGEIIDKLPQRIAQFEERPVGLQPED